MRRKTSKPEVKVVRESKTGRNLKFEDGTKEMSRTEFVKKIEAGEYPEYHIRKINGIKTPVSNPDDSKSDNLG